jgi:hypothetical protein
MILVRPEDDLGKGPWIYKLLGNFFKYSLTLNSTFANIISIIGAVIQNSHCRIVAQHIIVLAYSSL